MSNLKELRLQRNSVRSIYQLTSAMKMVSSAKFQRSQTSFRETKSIVQKIEGWMTYVRAKALSHPLFNTVSDGPALLIVQTAEKSLCGGFHQKIIKAAVGWIRENPNCQVICLGPKIESVLRKEVNPEILHVFTNIFQELQFIEFSNLVKQLVAERRFSKGLFLYTRFQNALVQEPCFHNLFPLSPPEESTADPEVWKDGVLSYYPSPENVAELVTDLYLEAVLNSLVLESQVSEHAARRAAMDAATQNAEKMMKKLALEYNRLRQSLITNELIEIISGAAAL
jgi:F-type H+-transporting ATPase subunit gamma